MKKKLLSAVLVTTMLFLSACNSTATSTTKANNEPGKTEAETTADASEITTSSESDKGATSDPSGKYTYTVYEGTEYETKLTLNVNIDDYVLNVEGKKLPFFSIGKLWEELGYLVDGKYKPSEFDWTTSPVYETYIYGDTQMVFRFNGPYPNKDESTGYSQMYSFDYHLAPISNFEANARTDEEIATSKTSGLYCGITVHFRQHPKDICYYTSGCNGYTETLSREDAIIITYVLSSAITRPGENPFVGTNLEKALSMSGTSYITYTLP